MNSFLVGILAGAASALLSLVLVTGLPIAVIFLYLSPLPILIVSLGWRHQAGLVATTIGAVALSPLSLNASLVFIAGIGLPSWWLAYLLLLGRQTDNGMQWYPLGRILVWIVGIAAAQLFAVLFFIGDGSHAGYVELINSFLTLMEPQLREVFGSQYNAEHLAEVLAILIPSSFASFMVFLYVLNIWIAARSLAVSKRLLRPWPFIPATQMPRIVVAAAVAGFAISFLEGFAGIAGLVLFSASSTALLFQGLAMIHQISQSWRQRRLILWLVYIAIVLLPSAGGSFFAFVGPAVTVLGLADVLFNIRNRFGFGNAVPPNDNDNSF